MDDLDKSQLEPRVCGLEVWLYVGYHVHVEARCDELWLGVGYNVTIAEDARVKL